MAQEHYNPMFNVFVVGVVSRLGAAAAGCYGSIMINICILVIGLLFWYKPNKIFIPFVLLVAVILPPVGLIWAWWLVREKVPAVSPANKDKCELIHLYHAMWVIAVRLSTRQLLVFVSAFENLAPIHVGGRAIQTIFSKIYSLGLEHCIT